MSTRNRIRQLSRLAQSYPSASDKSFKSLKLKFPYFTSASNTTPHFSVALTDTTNMAFSMWVRVLDTTITDHIGLGMFSRTGSTDHAASLMIRYDSTLYLRLDYTKDSTFQAFNSTYTDANVADGEWHWLAVVYNGNTLTLHIDGFSETFTPGTRFAIDEFRLGNSYSQGTGGTGDEYAQAVEFFDIRVHTDATTAFDFSEYWNSPDFDGWTGTVWQSESGTELVSTPSGLNLAWQGASQYQPSLEGGSATANTRGYISGFGDEYPLAETETPGLHPIGHNLLYASGSVPSGMTDNRDLVHPNQTPQITASGNSLDIPDTEKAVLDMVNQFDRETNVFLGRFVKRSGA